LKRVLKKRIEFFYVIILRASMSIQKHMKLK